MASNPLDKVYLSQANLTTIAEGGSISSGDDSYSADENAIYLVPDEMGDLVQTTGQSTTDIMSQKAVTDAINTKQDKPSYETKTIQTTDWTALSSSTPYTYSATVSTTATISTNTLIELINDNPVLFATYGFAIASVSGQDITIYSIGLPATDVSLKIGIGG